MIFLFVASTTLALTSGTYANDDRQTTDNEMSTTDYQGDVANGFAGYADTGVYSQTSTPDANGMVTTQYAFGEHYFTKIVDNVRTQQIADNSWDLTGSNYVTENPANSLIDVKVGGGGVVDIQSTYTGYTYNAGATDYSGAIVATQIPGLFDNPMVAPTSGPTATPTHTFETGTTASCLTTGYTDVPGFHCGANGWELMLNMCADSNCSTSDHNSNLYIGNGVYSLNRVNWGVLTNITDSHLVYNINPYSSDLTTYTLEDFEVQYRTSASDDFSTLLDLENTPIEHRMEWRIIPRGENISKNHPVGGFTPHIKVCNENPAKVGDQDANYNQTKCDTDAEQSTTLYRKGDSLIISVGLDADYLANNTMTDKLLHFDPPLHFYDNMGSAGSTAWTSADEVDIGNGADGNWRIGVDRDGSTFYDFNNKDSQYNDYEIGDGWCGDNSVNWDEGNAACRFSPVTFANDHWDSNNPNDAMAGLPIFDTTLDFDGMVVEMAIDKGEFIQNGRAGWNDIHLELGLQAIPYHRTTSATGNIDGWFETCFNGYVDIYIMPEGDWLSWYESAYWQYSYNPTSSSGFNDPWSYPNSQEWDIAGDNEIGYDEYWYSPGTTYNDDGYTRGPGDLHEMDLTGSNYWKHPYSHSYGGTLQGAEMAINPFHYHHDASPTNPEGLGTRLFNEVFENGGGIGSGNDRPGWGNQEYIDGTHKSSFDQVHDFWDINMYDSSDFPNGPRGEYDAGSGTLGASGAFGPNSGLSAYHQKTIRLGTSTTDFCYDPISTTGSTRNDASGVAIEPNNNILLSHDSTSGETTLNIEIGNDFYAPLTYAATRGTSELVDAGWLSSSADTTVGFTMLVDVRNKNGPSSEVCWGDWGATTDEVDDISRDDRDFCLDEGSVLSRNDVDWSTFDSETSCVSDEPAATQSGQNPDKAFWCGLQFETAFSDRASIQLKAETAPVNIAQDDDNDGVPNSHDDCANTAANTQVNLFGCPDQDGDGIADTDDPCPNDPLNACNNTPPAQEANCYNGIDDDGDGWTDLDDADCNGKGGTNDVDNDGIFDMFDRCDRLNGDGARTDKSTYTAQDHADWLLNPQDYLIDSDGCPIPIGDGGDGHDYENDCPQNQPDTGIYAYEDNDGDGRIDEDPIDGYDNDQDGEIDEDWLDDCLYDGTDVLYDSQFTGSMEIILDHQDASGKWQSGGSGLIAENNSGKASGNTNMIYNASYEETHGALSDTNQAFLEQVVHDDWMDSQLTCTVNGLSMQSVYMRGYLSVWIPNSELESENRGNVNHPGGDGTTGNWMHYGKSVPGTMAASVSDYSGWAQTANGESHVASSTGDLSGSGHGILNDIIFMQPHLGEGYYKYDCVASYQVTATSGQLVWAQGHATEVFGAVEMCEDGSSPVPAQPGTGDCASSSGGSDLGDDLNSFWDYLTDALLALGVLILLLGGAAVLWFIDMKQQAVGVGVLGVGVTLALFVSNVELETSTADIIGTLAHVGILVGVLIAVMGMFSERTSYTVNALVYGLFATWFIVHTISLMGSDDMMEWVADSFFADLIVPAIPIVALLAAIATTGMAVLNLVLAFNFVDEDSVWGEVASLGMDGE